MARLMSVAFTEQAVRDRAKTVTRRKGWWLDKNGKRLLLPGEQLTLCRKVMGRKKGEPLVRICNVEVVSVRRECLRDLLTLHDYAADEMALEGFPGIEARDFVRRYFTEAQGISEFADVTRIEWRYIDANRCDDCGRDLEPDHGGVCVECSWTRYYEVDVPRDVEWWAGESA